MKPHKALLLCSLDFFIFSPCEGKIGRTIAFRQNGHSEKIKPNSSKNSTFTLDPIILQIVQNRVKRVLETVKFELYISDSVLLNPDFQNYHLEFNPYLETNT